MNPCRALILVAIAWGCLGCRQRVPETMDVSGEPWAVIAEKARGTTVRIAMWDGDPAINRFMRNYVKARMKSEHDVNVEFIGGYGHTLVDRLMVELAAGKTIGDIDLMWINGETFFQLRQIQALFGPFTELLPNSEYIDWNDPFIAIDFQQPIDGYECPWGSVQQALIYHSERVKTPPRNRSELARWIHENPGRFTIDHQFTGMTFLKGLLYDFSGGPGTWDGAFDEEKYHRESAKMWDYLRDLRPSLWRRGETYPEGVAQLHQLMMNGEIDFSISNNDGEVDNKVLQGILPAAARGYVLESGSIRNSHYLGIPIHAPNKAGAMVLANLLISPQAQWQKALPDVWGDGWVLDLERLPEEDQIRFANIPGRQRIASREELASKALQEPAPEIMLRLQQDFRKYMIEGR